MYPYENLKLNIPNFIWPIVNFFPDWFVQQWQLNRLNRLLSLVHRSGVYRDYYKDKPTVDIKTIIDLKRLPIIKKSYLNTRLYSDLILTGRHASALANYLICRSDGEPFMFYSDPFFVPIYEKLLSGLGFKSINLKKERIIFIGHENIRENNILQFSISSLASQPEKQLESIASFRPSYLFFKNSRMLRVFSEMILKLGFIDRLRLKSIFITNPYIGEEERAEYRRFFNCDILLSVYPLAHEAPFLGWECEYKNGLHLNRASYILEVVDETGQSLPSGQTGRLIITRLDNELMPLIRFDTGDRGYIVKNLCPCGRHLPLFKMMPYDPDIIVGGKILGYDDFAFIFRLYYGLVKKFDIVQSQNSIKIKILPGKRWRSDYLRYLKDAVAELIGDLDAVDFELIK